MQTKLTLRLEQDLIEEAKRYAASNGKSVSQLVSDYFSLLVTRSAPLPTTAPVTESLRGVMRGAEVSEKDYRDYLERKHR